MINSILASELREKAGSDSFNRFEYQVHWIVYHMIKEFQLNNEFFIFCEFHDDMAKIGGLSTPQCMEFYQVKTASKYSEWTLDRLTRTTTKRNGGIKHSFLGFIFYNFMKFNQECSKCHFVSNKGIDSKIATWQSIIEDNKELEIENNLLFQEIKKSLRSEYLEVDQDKFDEVFKKFVQNTYIYYGDLTLENYEDVVAGKFFSMLENDNIFTSNSNKILRDIINVVRRKSKKVISTPISYKSLKEIKGISSDIFIGLKEQMSNIPDVGMKCIEIEEFLKNNGFSLPKIRLICRKLKEHHNTMLDISNSLYQDCILEIMKIIDCIIEENYHEIDDLILLKTKLLIACNESMIKWQDINEILLEALLYERLLS